MTHIAQKVFNNLCELTGDNESWRLSIYVNQPQKVVSKNVILGLLNMTEKNYLQQLNDPQRDAVLTTRGPVMIIAGAGSGKTRVLTYRIAHLMNEGIDPFNILSLTFTNKAAREMKDRIVRLVGNDARNLWMGTFHSVFSRILRFEHEKLNYPAAFTIYDTEDSKNLIKAMVKELALDDKQYKAGMVLGRISAAKSNLMSVKEYNDNAELKAQDNSSGRPKMGILYEQYQKRLFNSGAMDFDDLLFNTYRLLSRFPDVLHKYQIRFQYILVDEYQDTNFAQYAIVKKLAAMNENICVVGDDAQSIYAFRGANIQNILSFEKDYPDLKVFKLEQNYRSTANIVNLANSAILHNRDQLKKDVWTQNVEGDKISVMRALSDNEEGKLIANSIFQDKANYHFAYRDFAVLYRTNSQSRAMEESLRRLNIPYRIFGGMSFYQRKEIKDLLAYFRLTLNPNDEEAFKRVINFPGRGIGKTTIEKLVVAAASEGISLWDTIQRGNYQKIGISAGIFTKLANFVTMIQSFAVMLPTHDAYAVAAHIAKSSGLLGELYADKTPEGISHFENLQELLNGIKEFVENVADTQAAGVEFAAGNDGEYPEMIDRSSTLDVFMKDIALLTDADQNAPEDNDKVNLMTIHAAKGLEFKQVMVVGLEDNLFPSYMSLNSREELEEERRLFYVAITRAERRLVLSYAESRYKWGNLTACEPSRFLEELDEKYLDIQFQKKQQVRQEQFERWGGLGSNTTAPPKAGFKPVQKAAVKSEPQADPNFVACDPSLIEVGMEIEHQRFGVGKVTNLEGNVGDRKATILFKGTGQKQLLLKFARLRILN